MKASSVIGLALASVMGVIGAGPISARAAEGGAGRFALLVGSNLGDRGDPILRHAEQDAVRLAQTLRLMGEFPADQVVLMTGATGPEMRDAIIRLNARLREQGNGVLVVYYSGHADAQTLHLSGTRLPLAELKALLVGSPAVSRLLIVDACRSGSLIQLKGARAVPAFAVPGSGLAASGMPALAEPLPEGFAVLTSSAAAEDSQESAALGSSYFTYYVNSGLMGAADQDHNGAVTLSELYAFASSETRAATASSAAGPQNPTFQFALGGRHDLVLTRLTRRDGRLGALRFGQPGRYLVQRRDVAGLSPPIAELASRDAGAELALAPGSYKVTLRSERDVSQSDFVVAGGETTLVDLAHLIRIDVGRTVRKGGARRSATGFTVATGWHTAETEASTLVLGSGPNLLASLRHDRRRFSLEARVGVERAQHTDLRAIEFDNRAITPSGAILFPFDWSAATLAVGFEAGLVLLHQTLAAGAEHSRIVSAPLTQSLLTPHWSRGVQFGPLAQLDSPIGANTYLRLEVGLLWRVFEGAGSSSAGSTTYLRSAHMRFLGGIGVAF